MAEIAAFVIARFAPIVREFNLRILVAGGGQEDQREFACLAIEAAQLIAISFSFFLFCITGKCSKLV